MSHSYGRIVGILNYVIIKIVICQGVRSATHNIQKKHTYMDDITKLSCPLK